MKLLTEQIKKTLREKGTDTDSPDIICKFFDPCGSWTWYVASGEQTKDGDKIDWLFYGLVEGFEKEWGYFALSELESMRGPLGLGIERDIHFSPKSISL